MLTLKSFDGGEFSAYLALPASGHGPGIVVLQEIFGVNQYIRSVCDWYAAHGFVALCPDLFWRQQPGVELTDKSETDWQKAIAFYNGLDEAKAVEDSAAAAARSVFVSEAILHGCSRCDSNLIVRLVITA